MTLTAMLLLSAFLLSIILLVLIIALVIQPAEKPMLSRRVKSDIKKIKEQIEKSDH